MNLVSASLFAALVAVTLMITAWASKRNKSAADHYVAGGSLTGRQNGVAIAGDFISAASFLGVTGAIALTGYNGFYLAVFVPVAFVLAMLLIAEPCATSAASRWRMSSPPDSPARTCGR